MAYKSDNVFNGIKTKFGFGSRGVSSSDYDEEADAYSPSGNYDYSNDDRDYMNDAYYSQPVPEQYPSAESNANKYSGYQSDADYDISPQEFEQSVVIERKPRATTLYKNALLEQDEASAGNTASSSGYVTGYNCVSSEDARSHINAAVQDSRYSAAQNRPDTYGQTVQPSPQSSPYSPYRNDANPPLGEERDVARGDIGAFNQGRAGYPTTDAYPADEPYRSPYGGQGSSAPSPQQFVQQIPTQVPTQMPINPRDTQSRMPYTRTSIAKSNDATLGPLRNLSIYRPLSVNEEEYIAHSLRNGEAVVLNFNYTDRETAKRILDFSFGAASMVNAKVECIAVNVFAVYFGAALTNAEKTFLQNQGALS